MGRKRNLLLFTETGPLPGSRSVFTGTVESSAGASGCCCSWEEGGMIGPLPVEYGETVAAGSIEESDTPTCGSQ